MLISNEGLNKQKRRYIIQPPLQSGVNIKTINGESILGAGNLEVGGGESLPLSIIDGKLNITFNE